MAGEAGEQPPPLVGEAGGGEPENEEWRDWAGGVPADVLAKVAEALVAQTEADWAARLEAQGRSASQVRAALEQRKRDGNCLFVFARVCRGWRKAQLKVGGPLRTRVESDVLLPGRVELADWALKEGCPRRRERPPAVNLAFAAAMYGRWELVRWLCRERGFNATAFPGRRWSRPLREVQHGPAGAADGAGTPGPVFNLTAGMGFPPQADHGPSRCTRTPGGGGG